MIALRAARLAAILSLLPVGDLASAAQPVAAAPAFAALSGAPAQGALVRGQVPSGTLRVTLDGRSVPVDPQGSFLLGFDRDHGSPATLAFELSDGRMIRQVLAVAPRAWKLERINQQRPSTGPTEEYQRRRDIELARIGAARATASDSQGWRQAFILPARGRISGRFGSQRIYRGGVPAAFHTGVDLAPGAGKPVVAPADGVVVLAGPPMFSLEGNLVIIDHGLGLNSAFLHMAATQVKVGDRVRQGQMIGTVGATGRATGPHLHWSVKWQDARLDPLGLVATSPGAP